MATLATVQLGSTGLESIGFQFKLDALDMNFLEPCTSEL